MFLLFVDILLISAIFSLIHIGFVFSSALVLGMFLIGAIFDDASTYLCAKIAGMPAFYCCEENKTAKKCVKKYGLAKGLILSEFHPNKIFWELVLITIFGIGGMFLSGNMEISLQRIATPGILFVGATRIVVSINNINEIREEIWDRWTLGKINKEEL